MLIFLSCKPKQIAWFLASLMYLELVLTPLMARSENHSYPVKRYSSGMNPFPLTKKAAAPKAVATPTKKQPETGGPGQPEMSSFSSVSGSNLVDLFTGDFSYSIPLMDVGGYPLVLGYRGGISMDQEASWCGLGWNVNPGTVSRNMRGLPDDFNGAADTVKKVMNIRENKTIGVSVGADIELVGLPLRVGASLGVFHNNYKGWGLEHAINASINSGSSAKGPLSGGLSITNNSQEGLTIAPSLSLKLWQYQQDEQSGAVGSFSISSPYNSRTGLRGLQMSTGVRQYYNDMVNQTQGYSSDATAVISFASPAVTPSITMPYTSRQFSFTGKVGLEQKVFHPDMFISGYVSKQRIDPADTLASMPSYGYMYYQDGARNRAALLDFNREKELPYREKPATAHIAVPQYTFDAFSITGEGTGGMFRAYRGDIGFVYDHYMRTRDESNRLSVDIGVGDLVHGGVDLNINRAFTQNGPWVTQNPLQQVIDFKSNSSNYEAVYLRNPGEKAVNSKAFYDSVGGDDVVTVGLYQAGNGPLIQTTNYLNRYRNKRLAGSKLITKNSLKAQRDKRTQVISFLTAKEASTAAVSKYIVSYPLNTFTLQSCTPANLEADNANGVGLVGEYFRTINVTGASSRRTDAGINFNWEKNPPDILSPQSDRFSVRWTGRVKAPATGRYTLTTTTDDGVRLWLNDSLLINDWVDHGAKSTSATVDLVAGEFYKIRMEFYDNKGHANVKLEWTYPGQATRQVIPATFLYPPAVDFYRDANNLLNEKRVNSFRKDNHISEVTVLNNDGKRYVYGIPVYNLRQRDVTFAANYLLGRTQTGLIGYSNADASAANNRNGKDNYFNSEEIPAYAHSFLLTGILSSDYADVTGNGISDDDIGDAVKFNYSRVCGIANPFGWRAPYVADSVTYNPGLKTDNRDDKGNYVFGQKELWYLHSIESKTMIATFVTEARADMPTLDDRGAKLNANDARRLKQINLYSKAEFLKRGTNAKPIKTAHFEYAYDLCRGINGNTANGKLTLKRVWFTYNGNDKGQKNAYVFNYSAKNPTYAINAYDRWGNYKDPAQNPGSVPGNVISNADYPYTLQDSTAAAANASAWSLDSIYLPSGGSIKVNYESDDYAYVQNKRAMQLFKIRALGNSTSLPGDPSRLYTADGDNLYVFVNVPYAVSNSQDIYRKYLADIKKLYFRLYVSMPGDQWGSGSEYVSCYADFESAASYGMVNANTIWVKVAGISLKGDGSGSFSPLAKAAIQFLRLNLPSKAYPGSEVGDDIDLERGVRMIASLGENIRSAFESYDRTARNKGYANRIDTARSYIRLNNPFFKKYGGGHRVKSIVIYDNWDKMTGQRAATYGQQYSYTTNTQINGVNMTVSSGVAAYEPGIGGDENPFHVPIEYVEKIAPLGPVTLGYSEEPLGESFFPSPVVGYSNVRVRTIHFKNRKSANGYEDTRFYTAYDFPTFTDRTVLDNDTKKRYKPALANFLRVNAKHYISLSQGFKIELNDMHGKLRSKAYFAETDPVNPVSYNEHLYRVEDASAPHKKLLNTVMAISPDGAIDTTALIGKDVELMVDMREQVSITNGNNVNLNTELFTIPWPLPPFFIIPSLLNLAQREENIFRSAATTKVIYRYGILDSIISIERGSKVSTKDVLYDSETGEVLLRRSQNEFNRPVYSFTYPSHWSYDGLGLAYKNIGVVLDHVTLRDGKIVSALPLPDSVLFSGGDEILVAGKQRTNRTTGGCTDTISTFPLYNKIWAIDTSLLSGKGGKSFYFLDREGNPYTAYDISMKVIRSGRRNMSSVVGSVTSLNNPLVKNASTQQYQLVLNTDSKVLSASATEFSSYWNKNIYCPSCPTGAGTQGGRCVLDTAARIDSVFTVCLMGAQNSAYSVCGTFIYSQYSVPYRPFIRTQIPLSNTYWRNVAGGASCGYDPIDTLNVLPPASLAKTSEALSKKADTLASARVALAPPERDGPLNRSGVWMCGNSSLPHGVWVGFSVPLKVPVSKDYYIGMAGDNRVRFYMDGVLMKADDPDRGSNREYNGENFKIWHIYSMYLDTNKVHVLRIEGLNDGSAAGFGLEIYDATADQLINATNDVQARIIFSTKNLINRTFPREYSCPPGYTLDSTANGQFVCRRVIPGIKYGNPFVNGAFGNWRVQRSYVYYTARAESDARASTNIAENGTFGDFTPLWQNQSGKWRAVYDSTKWVWNTEVTQYNRKGMESENKDALGRYRSALYGYNLTMPTAVVQNGRNREVAYEGFEDYGFETQACDNDCKDKRHLDLSAYANKITTLQKHTGKSSLRLNAGESLAISATVSDSLQENRKPVIRFTTTTNSCVPSQTLLSNLQYDNDSIPKFSPSKGKRMLISAWVREDQDCKCVSYTNNRILVGFTGVGTTQVFAPTGNIIEGWQRYEAVFDIPTAATAITINLQATGSTTAYFDDLRIQPFSAIMQSFVYHPENLRMMAELDVNNYATYYEYDDDGTLIRTKKETERGIRTTTETRSALIKQ